MIVNVGYESVFRRETTGFRQSTAACNFFSTAAYDAVLFRITILLAKWGMAFSCGKFCGWQPPLDKSNLRLDSLKSSGTEVLVQALRQAVIAGRLLTSHKHCMKVTGR